MLTQESKLQNTRRRRRRRRRRRCYSSSWEFARIFLGSLQNYFARSFLSWIYSTTCIKKETWWVMMRMVEAMSFPHHMLVHTHLLQDSKVRQKKKKLMTTMSSSWISGIPYCMGRFELLYPSTGKNLLANPSSNSRRETTTTASKLQQQQQMGCRNQQEDCRQKSMWVVGILRYKLVRISCSTCFQLLGVSCHYLRGLKPWKATCRLQQQQIPE